MIPSLLSFESLQLSALYGQWKRQQSKEEEANGGDDGSGIEHVDEEEDGTEYEYEYEYYRGKMGHDIEWNGAHSSNENLFIVSKDLFDPTESSEFVEEINSYDHLRNTHSVYQQNTKIKRRRKWKFGSNPKRKKKEQFGPDIAAEAECGGTENEHAMELKEAAPMSESESGNVSGAKSGFSVWTESLNSMVMAA